MKVLTSSKCNDKSITSKDPYENNSLNENMKVSCIDEESISEFDENGKYSIFEIASWFLNKSPLTHKKIQKLCYYAQAWNYALRGTRLISTDFEAWTHGPVSPLLYDRLKKFGFNAIKLGKPYNSNIEKKDQELLEDVWETYGDITGNALEALSHSELPWIEAREGYSENERCNVTISPNTMKTFYKSIYKKEDE